MGNSQGNPDPKSFQTGQKNNPTFRELLFGNCCSKININNEDAQFYESDVFFGSKIESMNPKGIEFINY